MKSENWGEIGDKYKPLIMFVGMGGESIKHSVKAVWNMRGFKKNVMEQVQLQRQ